MLIFTEAIMCSKRCAVQNQGITLSKHYVYVSVISLFYNFGWSPFCYSGRVQRKSFLQLAIGASQSLHLLAQMSFQLALKTF